ncbi:plasmid mobilization relaxosome protein MobC [Fluviicola sp.]|uniref:plasmid mobilization protein n=1 Tax=Fluviicola sp. TaxID=1917219 RepID=UPI0031D0436D
MEENRQQGRTRMIGVRLTPQEYLGIEKKWKQTTFGKLSDYLRSVIFGKPVTTLYRNQSADDLLAEMALLRQELNRIGVNFNQSVKKLHVLHETPQFMRWLTTHEVEKRTMLNKLDEINNRIHKFSERLWSQG